MDSRNGKELGESPRLGEIILRALRKREGDRLGTVLASMDPWKTLGYGAEALSRYLTKKDATLHRAAVVSSEGLAGILCVRFPWLRGPFVELLAILPEEQARGIGRQVLFKIETEPRWRASNIWVTVSSFNREARSFYERCGYREVATLPRLVAANGEEILLRREIGERRGRGSEFCPIG